MKRVALLALLPVLAVGGPVTVKVDGIDRADGTIFVAVCAKQYFMNPACPIGTSTAAALEGASVTFPAISDGRYAVMVFHDLNGNGKLDFGLMRPKEPWGLSGRKTLAPNFDASAVEIGAEPATITVTLRK
jgi:uncharacterized protein (DUF2141 family)